MTDTAALPTWDQMSDLDKGAALLHVRKRSWEGANYAVENYPCRYLDNPALVALDRQAASSHAVRVSGGWNRAHDRLGTDEVTRLYDAALDEDDRRRGVNRGVA